jgi:hypothetical protein
MTIFSLPAIACVDSGIRACPEAHGPEPVKRNAIMEVKPKNRSTLCLAISTPWHTCTKAARAGRHSLWHLGIGNYPGLRF